MRRETESSTGAGIAAGARGVRVECGKSRRFRAVCRDFRLRQECITPYAPEQNGMIERFFRSLKEECVSQHLFPSFAAARRDIAAWIRWYSEARPH